MPDKKQPVDQRKAESLRKWAEVMQDPRSDLMHKLSYVLLDVDLMKDVEDAISTRITYSTSENAREMWHRILDRYKRGYFASLVRKVADTTGADPAQIADKDTRTPEQQQALLEEFARRQLARMDKLFDSNYMKAVQALDTVEGIWDETDKQKANKEISTKETLLYYYFVTRPDIRPSEAGQFTDADKEALIAKYKRFEAFLVNYFGDAKKAGETVDGDFMIALQAFISAENPADAQEIIEHLSSVLPEKYVIPNNKLANTMTRGIVDIGKITLEESKKGAKKLIETTCILTYADDNVKLTGRQPFTEYDRNVYNAVSSLYVYGDPSHVVTPAQVYRAMTGMNDTEKPTSGQIAAVTNSIDKMRFIRARIDCTAELQARRITLNSKQINGGEIDTYLLTADAVKVQAGGQTVKAYRIIKTPILYEYAAAVNQVLSLPASTLDVKELDSNGVITTRILPNTESRILIKGYLIRRIEGMKGKNGLKNPVIALYDYERDGDTHQGLYSIAGKPDAKNVEAKRIRTDVEKMLSYWQAIRYISGYAIQTREKKITGYKITV